MIISCDSITKSFGDTPILRGVTFALGDTEKTAVIGVNGAGKSTLLNIITGVLTPDSGIVSVRKGATIGYLRQTGDLDDGASIERELTSVFADVIAAEARLREIESSMNRETGDAYERISDEYDRLTLFIEQNRGFEYKSLVRGMIKGMGFTEDEARLPVGRLSGGRKSRVALAKLLLTSPDLLLLDEPTNHLDIPSIEWLEDAFLKNYPGAVLLICHDRYFLDKTVSKIVEIEHGTATTFGGNYTYYAVRKAVLRDQAERDYQNARRERERQEAVIAKLKSFNREKSVRRARSREKALARLPEAARPKNAPPPIRIDLEPAVQSGDDVLSVRNVSKSFGSRKLFAGVSFELTRGSVTAVVGANGIGKTTLMRMIMGELSADAGVIRAGAGVRIAYFDQENTRLNEQGDILSELTDAFPRHKVSKLRNALAAFRFVGDEVFKPVSTLSGGEKRRLALLKLMLTNANFILMDEPTNHLDMNSKEALEEALSGYAGTVLYISHDRYFINATADCIIELTETGVVKYDGDFDYYTEKKRELSETSAEERKSASGGQAATKPDRSQKRRMTARLAKLESEIAASEDRLADCDKRLSDPGVYSDYAAVMDVNADKERLTETIAALYAEWETLAAELAR